MLIKLVEQLDRVLDPVPKPFIQEASQLELKPLPFYLRYIFLGDNNTLPIILSIPCLQPRLKLLMLC